ncbi:MAG TPA: hypothetical protein VHM90_02255 [Phycisphaerae bacterium]|nr:hypothetical protein [Phycisphaerae bacterium]
MLKEETVEEIRIQATSAIALPGVGDLMDFDDWPESYEFPMQDCHNQAFLLQTTDQQLIIVRLRQPFLFWEEGSTAELASVWPNSDMTLVISRASRLPIRGLFLGERLVPMVWTRMECKLWPSREPRDAVYVGNAMPGSIDQLEEYFRTAGFERLFRVGEDGR